MTMYKRPGFFITLIGCLMLYGCAPSMIELNSGIDNFRAQNYRTAFIKLLPIAERGNPEAQYAVAYMYYYGQGVTEDRDKAYYWMKLAATAGQKQAQSALKMLHNLPRSEYAPARNPRKRPLPIQEI